MNMTQQADDRTALAIATSIFSVLLSTLSFCRKLGKKANRSLKTLKTILVLGFLLFIPFLSNAQTTLAAGDIAFTGFNCLDNTVNGTTSDREFSFILLKDIAANTEIFFTDFGWTSTNKFQVANSCGASTGAVTDGVIKWKATSAMSYGTQIMIRARVSLTSNFGTVTGVQATFNSSTQYITSATGGDQIFAYQGSLASPTFISGINLVADWVTSLTDCLFSSTQSMLPSALSAGSVAFAPVFISGSAPNARLKPSLVIPATAAAARAAIYDKTNWDYVAYNTTAYQLPASNTVASSAPSITAQPSNSSICSGANTTFSITATGATSYQWQVNTGSGFIDISNGGVYSGATTATLTITGATAGMNGYQYRSVASGGGSTTSNAATLTVNSAPSVSTQPSNSTVCAGSNTSFTAIVANASSYQWQVNTGSGFGNITNGGVYSGATTTTLSITGATVGMNGYQYRLVSSGTCTPAATSNSVTLTVNSAPSISTQPANSTITAGANTTFSATVANATGYQWQVNTGSGFGNVSNGGVYSGATTATLTITGATVGMSTYQYRLVASGTCSPNVTSNAVTLTVNAASSASYEYFEGTSGQTFTNSTTGLNFTLGNKLASQNFTNFGVHASSTPSATVGSNYYIGNDGNTALNQANTITSTNKTLFTVKGMWIYPSSDALGGSPTNNGTITFTGKKNGVTQYTFTKSGIFQTSVNLGTNYNGFTLVDFSVGTDNSNTLIDELEITLGSNYRYIAIDNFAFTATPSVSNSAATSVTSTTATLNATVNPSASATSAISFDYSTSSTLASGVTNVAASPSTLASGNSATAVSAGITGLTGGVTYYYRAKATNSVGTNNNSTILSFTTTAPTVAPTVTTTAASAIASTSATLGGNVTADGGASVTDRGIVWATTTAPTTSNNKVANGTGTGTFSATVSSLPSSTLIYYRAYATNSAGTAYGAEQTFTTTAASSSPTQFWSDTFEDTGAPSAGTRTPSIDIGWPSVPYAYYFMRTDGTNLNLQAPFPGDPYTTYQNIQGSKFWAGEDTDRARTGVTDVNDKVQNITWTGINISGKTGLSFKGLFASHRSQGWQNIVFGATYDFLRVEYSIDGGAWTRVGSFVGDASATNAGYLSEDTDDDKIGDGTQLSKTFQEFTWPITGTGTTMSLRFLVSADASATQEFAIDNFRLFSTAVSASAPTVTTTAASAIATTSATLGGNVTADGGASVTDRGIVWATTTTPTTSNNKVANGTGTGTFSATVSSLPSGTLIYYRAYAINSAGTAYGTQQTFTTSAVAPTVTTTAASAIASTSATLGGNVTADGGASVTDRGIVWATTTAPTTSNNKVANGTGTGTFSATVSSLPSSTLIYYRAYATNSAGTTYGTEQSFTTLAPAGVLLSTSPTLHFSNSTGFSDNIAEDGEGGSTTISDINIQTYPINSSAVKISGSPLTYYDNNSPGWPGYPGIISYGDASAFYGWVIKSSDASNFSLVSLNFLDWGDQTGKTFKIEAFDGGLSKGSLSFVGNTTTAFKALSQTSGVPALVLPAAFGNVDEVRIYQADGGNSYIALNDIKVGTAVVTPAPSITTQPSANTICAGANTTFTAAASNATSYQWQVDQGAGFTNISNGAPYSGATTTTLTITGATAGMSGYLYRLVATGATSPAATSNSALLTVNSAPSITAQPSASTICAGSNTTFTATASNATGYQWQVDQGAGFSNISNGALYSGATTATLTITGATAGLNGYIYRVVVTGSCTPNVTSNSAALTVNSAPAITSQPSASTICAGSNTTFTATASNATGYQWQVDQGAGFSNISNGAPYSGATTATLTITGATAALNGYIYRVVVTGSCTPNATSNSAALTVNSAPAITAHPVDRTITVGSNTTFSATVSNATGYQWQVDQGSGFTNISNVAPYSGATTATLAITNATASMNGYVYRVIASGICTPAVTSNSATLILPVLSTSGTLSALSTTYGTASTAGSFSVSAVNLTSGVTLTAPAGFELSTSLGSGYANPITVGTSGTLSATTIYVRLKADAKAVSSPYSGNITLSSNGATNVTVATVSSTVATKPITLTLNNTPVITKIYNAGISATLAPANYSLTGIEGSDVVTVSGTATYDSKLIGTGKTITANAFVLAGADKDNYTLTTTSATTTGAITARSLTLALNSSPLITKIYDAGTTATLASGNYSLTGVQGSDAVTVSGTASYDTKLIGTGKTITANTFVLAGADKDNYTLTTTTATTTGTITAKALTLALNASPAITKTYDATTSATLAAGNYSLTGIQGSDAVTVSGTASYDTKQIGTGKTITANTFVLAGADKDNYTLTTTSATTTGAITSRNLTLALNSTPLITKIYDAGTTATLASGNYSLTGIQGSDAVTVSGTASYDTKLIGTGKTITANAFVLAGADKDNYTLTTTTATTTGAITARSLTVALNASPAITKTYDATTSATLAAGNYSLTGIQGSDAVTVSGTASYDTKLIGTGKTITANTFVLAGADKDNYTLTTTSATTTGAITARDLTLALNASPAITKVYDAGTTATLASGNYSLTGVQGSDAVTVSGTASYDTKLIGTGKTITANAFVLAGADKDNYTLTTTTATTTGAITARSLTLALNSTPAITKVYDATTTATLASGNYSLTGIQGSDAVTVSGTASYDSKQIGTGKTITANTFVLAGADKDNYTLTTTSATTTGAITTRDLTLALNASPAITKVYDAGTTATLASGNYSLTGVQGSDAVTVSGTASYDTKLIGTGKTITANAFVLAGADKDNYTLTTTTATTTGAITARSLTVALNASPAITKTYDATTSATLAAGNYSLTGIQGLDVVTVSGTASYDSKQIGTGKTVTANTFVLAGADKDNYTLTTTSATTTGAITARSLTLALNSTPAITKVYDATTTATLASGNYSLTGIQGSDAVTVSGTATYDSKLIGTGKTITANTFVLAGADKDNYTLTTTSATTTGAITSRSLTLALNSSPLITKIYDAGTTATLASGNYSLTGVQGSDAVTVSGTASYDTKLIGTGKTITANTFVLAGADKDNYTLTTTTATTTGTITAKALTLALNASPAITKTYDATTSAALAAGNYSLIGIQGSDAVTVSGTASYDTKQIGTGKTITANAFVLAGADKDNYTLTTTSATTTGAITSKSLTLALNSTPLITKIYDAGTTATLASGNYSLTGIQGSDAVTVSGTASYDTKLIGTGKTITANAFVLAGADKDNYTLTTTTATTTGAITARALTLALNSSPVINKIFDGNTTATLTSGNYSLTGIQGSDIVTVSGTASYNNKTVGTNKAITVNAFMLAGADKDNYTLTTTTANTTGSIEPLEIEVLAEAKSKVYGSTDPAFTYTFSPALITGDAFIGELKRAPGENIGTYAINQGTLAVTPNYRLMFAPANLTIGKRDILVTIDSKNKVYGSTDPQLTYSTSGLANGDSFTGVPSRVAGENTGSYVIGAGSLTLNNNYNVSYATGTFSITPKAITVSADAKSKIYGSVDPVLTYNSNGLVNGDALSGTLARATGENAGSYAISQGSLNGNGNYTITFVGNNLTIDKKALIIKADDKTRGVGAVDPVFTATYTGFATGDDSSVLTTQPVFTTTALATSPKGTYPISASGAVAANYSISYQDGTLTVAEGMISNIIMTTTPIYEGIAVGTGFGQLRTESDNQLGIYTYSLVSGTGSTDNNLFTIAGNFLRVGAILDYETKANYSVRIRSTDQNGLTFEKAFTINLIDVNEAPTLNAIANQAICTTTTDQVINLTGITPGPETGQVVTLSVTSNNPSLFTSLTVTKGTGTTGTLTYKLAPGASGTASISVIANDNGGISFGGVESITQRFTLTVNTLPVVAITSDKGTALFKGETAELTATGGTTYSWATANGIVSGQNTSVLTVKPDVTTTYTVTATNASGCSEIKTITLIVTERPIEDAVTAKATNIMSPNGDGVNDTWVVEDIAQYPNNSVRIVDRAGRLVYEKKGYDNTWDATLRGAPLAEGTYYYIIDFGDGKTIKKGFITILRKQ